MSRAYTGPVLMLVGVLALTACGESGGAASAEPTPALASASTATTPSAVTSRGPTSAAPATAIATPTTVTTPAALAATTIPSAAAPPPAATPAELVPITAEAGQAPTEAVPPTVEPASALARRDTPPDGVDGFIDIFGGAGGSCSTGEEVPPDTLRVGVRPNLYESQVEAGSGSPVCLDGFPDHTLVQISVTMPDGQVRAPDDGLGNIITFEPGDWSWISLPGDPLGEHTISASDGNLTATGTFTVLPSSRPRLYVLTSTVPVGGEVRAVVSGFPPGGVARVSLYVTAEGERCAGNPSGATFCYAFVTELNPPVGADGAGYLTLAADTPGSYLLNTMPAGQLSFDLTFDVVSEGMGSSMQHPGNGPVSL